jgi:sugar/nucleoside kinase (ribokinase family)
VERTPVVLAGRDSVMSLRRIQEEIVALADLEPARWNARHLHVAALLPGRRAARAYRRFAELAERDGCTLSVDVDARPRFWRAGGEPPGAILRAAGLVKCSALDLVALGLGRGAQAIGALRRRMSPSATLVVTDGLRPARALGPWGEIARAPRPIRAARAMGAGDAFSAGVIAELLASRGGARDERLWRRALDRGHRAARAVLVAAT